MPRKPSNSLASLVAGCMLAGAATFAPMPAAAEDWSGQVTLYGWGAGVTGDFTPFTDGPTLSFDKSLSEVLQDLDGAFFVTGLARRGDLVLFADFTYSASSREGLLPPVGAPASGEVTIRSLTLAAGQRFDVGGGTTVDAMGGLRAWRLDGQVSVPLVGIRIAPTADFVDPILALRVNTPLADRWSLLGYLDLGGFGVGSDLTYQVAVTANYQMNDSLYLSVGWRHLYIDYSDGGTVFKGSMTGPLLGATWRF
ncbi:hypothetical protein [Tabrizicola sp. YIM 78059]|uniref:hypothetical protein n=1 Tax=Tabrizicola sp. YIM 78059 TaxID=2529861 RepID=UPI0020C1174D|nr:hypothetical protein [Tabrizicola sp. YIM 78059]